MNLELIKPFYRVFTAPPHQWHPLLVHFPLAFLTVEVILILIFVLKRDPEYERWANYFLKASFWSALVVIAAGFHDCGLALGPGNKFLLGLQDRWENAFRFQSSVTVHFWLAISTFGILSLRFVWQWLNSKVLQSKGINLYGFITAIGFWCLLSASYVGGLMSHK